MLFISYGSPRTLDCWAVAPGIGVRQSCRGCGEHEESDGEEEHDSVGGGGYMARLRRRHKRKSRKMDLYKSKRKNKVKKGWGKVAAVQKMRLQQSGKSDAMQKK